ncbi:MAG TPA: vitamin B12 dependent-methionine synthase activation domain-containing protein [Geopsychrobacteraceae bacterium]|nr:vitamin B12 dependent-methionine synthase activation domain-containing protein [Geopsychrobacteraceae bacterium]
MKGDLSSLYQAIELKQEIPPLIIGERANPNGSRKFREFLLADDLDGCLQIGLEQESQGAQVIDLCAAYAGRDEKSDLPELVQKFSASLKAGLMIDSTDPDCIEASLKLYPGRCIINSINLEDGGVNLDRVCRLARRYGAAVVALTIDETGMAMTADEKFKVAAKIYHLAIDQHGLSPQDLLFDPLTFTIGSGDTTLFDAGVQTLNGIRKIKQQWPNVSTVLGVSNISFGLHPAVRKLINSVFLHEAVEAGLDAAIVDAAKVVPLAQISEEDRRFCLDLIYDRGRNEEHSPLMSLIEHFSDQDLSAEQEQKNGAVSTEEEIRQKLIGGDKEGLDDLLCILLQRHSGLEIINRLLVPAMREVGELFGRGELLLPFVLQSAEVMKRSVNFLEDYLEKETDASQQTSILLATVQGDVHDIGKNLVDIILSNNGYKVHNIGIKVPSETIIARARELNVDVIGLSGLLVKSAIVMQQSMPQYQAAGLSMPILLGGAALTPKFVAESCVPGYQAPVVYCADAFAGLKAIRDFEAGQLVSTTFHKNPQVKNKPGPKEEILTNHDVPQVPFLGRKTVRDVDVDKLFSYLNLQALFRGRWGYRRGKLGKEDYEQLIANTVEPLYARLKQQLIDEDLLQPQVVYGYFPCRSEGDNLIVSDEARTFTFDFPRQSVAPNLCIADYFKGQDPGEDLVGFFVVTIGERLAEITAELFQNDSYHDYLMMHGIGVELTDALAEYWHQWMREEMGFAEPAHEENIDYVTQEYRGSRYGFGYPACPDLDAHRDLFELLKPEEIGVSLTENLEMVPEMSTSAIVVHHPQAKYFAI